MSANFKALFIMSALILANGIAYQNCSPTTFTSDSAQLVQGKNQINGTGAAPSPTPALDTAPPQSTPPLHLIPPPSSTTEVGRCLTPRSCAPKLTKMSSLSSHSMDKDSDKDPENEKHMGLGHKEKDDDDDNEFCSDEKPERDEKTCDGDIKRIAHGQKVKMIQLKDAGSSTPVDVCMSRNACELVHKNLDSDGDLKRKGQDLAKSKDDDDGNDDDDGEEMAKAPKSIFEPMNPDKCAKIVSDADLAQLMPKAKAKSLAIKPPHK